MAWALQKGSMPTLNNDTLDKELARAAMVESGAVHLATSYTQLFSVEEAFVRLGQSRQTGELLVLNKDESIQVFVEDGFIVQAIGKKEQGEIAAIRALNLEAANFVWAAGSKAMEKNLHIDIREHVLRYSLNRDQKIARNRELQERETLALPATDSRRVALEKAKEGEYYFVTAAAPTERVPLKKAVTMLGRGTYCDWAIDDIRISRKHCVLQIASEGILVRDMDTINGTFINDKLINDGYLKAGDKLSLGGYVMTLQGGPRKADSPLRPKQASMAAVS